MFSKTTTELSTNIPTANARPDIDTMFKPIPMKYMTTKVPTKANGMEIPIAKVILIERKNKNKITNLGNSLASGLITDNNTGMQFEYAGNNYEQVFPCIAFL